MNTKVTDLNKELKDLKSLESSSAQKIQSLEEKMKEMASMFSEAKDKIRNLEMALKDVRDSGERGCVSAEEERNRSLVQKLTCEEVSNGYS